MGGKLDSPEGVLDPIWSSLERRSIIPDLQCEKSPPGRYLTAALNRSTGLPIRLDDVPTLVEGRSFGHEVRTGDASGTLSQGRLVGSRDGAVLTGMG